MVFPAKGIAQGLVLGILISLLQTDLNNLLENYSPYPEVQNVLHSENAALQVADARPTRFDLPTSPKHIIDDSEVILDRLLQTNHIEGHNTNFSAYLVTGLNRSSSVEVAASTTSHHYGSQFSSQHVTNLSLEDQDIIQLIMQTDEEQMNKETSFLPSPLQHQPYQVQHTYNSTVVMANTYQHVNENNNVVAEPAHPVYTTQTSLELELNDMEENGMFNDPIVVSPSFDENDSVIQSEYQQADVSIRADPSLASTSGTSLDMSMWSETESSTSKLLVDMPHQELNSLQRASENADELLKRVSSTDWDIDLDFDLDLDGDFEADLDVEDDFDSRRYSVSEDSAVGGSLSPKSWSDDRSVYSHEEGAVGGYLYENYMDTTNDEFSYPASHNIRHNHTYSAPYGGQPHIRKMDIKVTKEPSRGSAHDEIMCRKLKIPIPLEKIINSPVDEFNKLMKKHSLSSKQTTLVRDIRRRGKNKVAAQNCRAKKMSELSGLDGEIDDLRQKRNELKSANTELRFKHEQIRADLERITQQLSPQVKTEHGADFDPSHYTIEVDESGSLRAISIESRNSSERRSKRRRRR